MPDIPIDPEAEKRLLGCVVLNPALLDDLAIQPTDFHSKEMGGLFAAALDLSIDRKPITSRTLADASGVEIKTVYECVEGADATEASFWAERVVRARKRRQLFHAGEFATRLATDGSTDPDEATLRTEELLASLGQTEHEGSPLSDVVDRVMADIRRRIEHPGLISGLTTGWIKFDRLIDGLQPGAVISVYARTGSMKSFFMQNIAWRLGRDGVPGVMFTTEMTEKQVTERMLQLESGLNFRDLGYRGELGRHEQEIVEAADGFRLYPIWVCDRSIVDVQFARGFLSRLKRTHGIEWAGVDLVNHVHSTKFRDNETKNEAFVMQQIKQMAKDFEICIIVNAHVAKPDRGQRDTPKAYIDPDDMKGTSAYSQDADTTISLVLVTHNETGGYRPMTREERMQMQRAGEPMLVMASITKNRSGVLEDILFQFNMASGGLMTVEMDR